MKNALGCRLLVYGLAALAVACGGTPAAVDRVDAPSAAVTVGESAELERLVSLIGERLALAPAVAAAKYARAQAVDDPVREQQLLQDLAAQAQAAGMAQALVRALFEAQIEASKALQRRCIAAWDSGAEPAPRSSGDLAVVRQQIDRLNRELLQALAAWQSSGRDAVTAERLHELGRARWGGSWIDDTARDLALAPLLTP